jgi:hypothetical protein
MKLLLFVISCFLAIANIYSFTFQVTLHLPPSPGECALLNENDDLCEIDLDISTCTPEYDEILTYVIENYIISVI